METIHILHTNDLHSHFENWPQIRHFLHQRQHQFKARHETTLTFDIGDAMDRVHPLTEATNGQINTELLNDGNYDAVTIGNNEGIGNSHDQLEHLYDKADFPVLLANLFDKKTGQLADFAKPYQIVTSEQGTRIAMIGLTAPFFLTYEPNGWHPKVVQEVLPPLLKKLQGQYDILVILSHLGLPMDRYMAKHYPEINVICGGHTHHLLPDGEVDGTTLLTAAEKYGHYVGEITLQLNEQHQIVSEEATTHLTEKLPQEASDAAEITGYLEKGHELLAQDVLADLPEPLPIKHEGASPMIDTALEALCSEAHTDAAVLNTGLFLSSLPAGKVTRDDLHTQMPHPMHIIKVTLKGTDMWHLVMEMEKNRRYLLNFPMKGMGFRGKIFGDIRYRGIKYDAATRRVFWKDKPIDPEQTYTLATVDHYLFVPYFPTIEIVGNVEILFPGFLRDMVGRYLQKKFPA
ncbi:hypothetical protein IV38_GL002139 [Lactobacillus selangorensis]|uniref:Uncharacterized protein n=1 Tax=Lactobacillus selangorensis TaxID=81857 RepID=A0A0R2FRX3_9LACO|nr:bifunctional UDP-sugar hydrolase/5'-nucleotidase [Lactobacillus selangorensis]KRN27485.1 hypothetical protein IV38_GL002139 [Lactobacillus selangorensis]KRN31318.1 hypothetical protein IV40_GL001311 [Lactobacillus selangorensis]